MSDTSKHFFCKPCFEYWLTDDCRESDNGDIISDCPKCGRPTVEVPHYYANLPKMRATPNGPTSPEAKRRTSMNAYKHGLYVKQRTILAPAKKDKYPECSGCDHYEKCEPSGYCPINLNLITRFAEAYASGKIENIKEYAGLMQGNVAVIIKMLFNDIYKNGTLVKKVISSKVDEENQKEEIVLEWQGNPSLRRIPEFMELLGLGADQQEMTPAKQTESSNVKGYIDVEKDKQESLKEFQKRTTDSINDIRKSIINAATKRSQDEALQQFEKESGAKDNDK